MNEHPIKGMMETTLQKIKELVDASTVVGEPIISGGTTIIPISKISYGFASGGTDLPAKKTGEFFGGGGGAGATVTPVGFLVIKDGEVQMLQVDEHRDSAGKIIDMVPGLVDKLKTTLDSKKEKAQEEADKAKSENGAESKPASAKVTTRFGKQKNR